MNSDERINELMQEREERNKEEGTWEATPAEAGRVFPIGAEKGEYIHIYPIEGVETNILGEASPEFLGEALGALVHTVAEQVDPQFVTFVVMNVLGSLKEDKEEDKEDE